MAIAGVLDPSLGAVGYVVDALKNPNYTPHEKQAVLECIKSMAGNPEYVAELIKVRCLLYFGYRWRVATHCRVKKTK